MSTGLSQTERAAGSSHASERPSAENDSASDHDPAEPDAKLNTSWWGTRRALRARSISVWAIPSLVTLALGYFRAGRPTLGWDEAATWSASTRSIPQLFDLAGLIDIVITPYYLFMHVWIDIFGDSERAMRAPSWLAVAAAVGFTAAIGRRLFDARVGLTGALLMAVIPGISRYAQEARPYGIALFFAALSTWLLLGSLGIGSKRNAAGRITHPAWRWVAYSATIAALGLFHLLGLFILTGHFAFVAVTWWRARTTPQAWRTPLYWAIAAVIGVLPAIPLAWKGSSQRSQLYWLPHMKWDAFYNFPNPVFGVGTIGWLIAGLSLAATWREHSGRDRWIVPTLAIAVVGPAACLYVAAFATPMWVPRYVLYILIAWCLLAAVAIGRSWWRLGIVTVLVLLLSVQPQRTIRAPTGHETPDYRKIARVITEQERPGDGLMYPQNEAVWSIRAAFDYYLPAKNRPSDALAGKTPAENGSYYPSGCAPIERCLANINRMWVISTDTKHDPLAAYPEPDRSFLKQQFQQRSQWRVNNITVTLLERHAVG